MVMKIMKNGEKKLITRKGFEAFYTDFCLTRHIYPLPAVRAHLKDGVLDINGDIISLEDWQPILESLKVPNKLNFVAIRSYFVKQQFTPAQKFPIRRSASAKPKIPALHSREVIEKLCKSLKELLAKSSLIQFFELQGIPLQSQDLLTLKKGLCPNRSLRHLSLENCCIGDEGFKMITRGLKEVSSLVSINLINNCLTSKSIEIIAELIKFQSICLRDQAWQDSLRYRQPNIQQMTGLRRITLNNNPGIGDCGAKMLIDALQDDYWIKALDLQNCGIGNDAAKMFLDLCFFNPGLAVLDLRGNPQIDNYLIKRILEQLERNTSGKDYEYKWIKLETESEKLKALTKLDKKKTVSPPGRTKHCHSSIVYSKRNSLHPTWNLKGFHKHCYSAEIPRKVEKSSSRKERKSVRLAPWRVNKRLQRYRGYPRNHFPGKLSLEEKFECRKLPVESKSGSTLASNWDGDEILVGGETRLRNKQKSDLKSGKHLVSSSSDLLLPRDDNYDDAKITKAAKNSKIKSQYRTIDYRHVTYVDGNSSSAASVVLDPEVMSSIQELKSEVLGCRRRLELETKSRKEMEHQIINLTLENNHLRQELEEVLREHDQRVGEDDLLLDSVEKSFQQFHAFLDYLEDAGLGSLIAASGLRSKLLDVQQVSSRIGQNFQLHHRNTSLHHEQPHYNSPRETSSPTLKLSPSSRYRTTSNIKSKEIHYKEPQNFSDLPSLNVSEILSPSNKVTKRESQNYERESTQSSFNYELRKLSESQSSPEIRGNSVPNDHAEEAKPNLVFNTIPSKQTAFQSFRSKLYNSLQLPESEDVRISHVVPTENKSSMSKIETIKSPNSKWKPPSSSSRPSSKIPVPKPESQPASRKVFFKNGNSKKKTEDGNFEKTTKDFVKKNKHKEVELSSFDLDYSRDREGKITNYSETLDHFHASYFSDNSLSRSSTYKEEQIFITEEEF